jgi:hypothetical protein
MGFLSKLMKNPLMQMLAPMAMAWAAPYAFGATGLTSLFGGMNPMAANALKQGLLGYGTGMLTGAEDPGKQGMYAGLASLPFSYMSAAQQAKQFNRNWSGPGVTPRYKDISGVQRGYGAGQVDPKLYSAAGHKPIWAHTGYDTAQGPKNVTAWDILGSKGGKTMRVPGMEHPTRMISAGTSADPMTLKDFMPPHDRFLDADIFSKTSPGGYNKWGKPAPPMGTVSPDWVPTMAIQGLAATGEYMGSQDERARKAWDKKKKQRRKELAWMYGVPEDQIEGEMDNPWYTGGGFWNKGGIASLENGGDVSGPGTGTSDSIDAKLSDGEFVMTAKAVENLGNGDRYTGARKMYDMMNMLDPESEAMSEAV